jgi:3',5'-cyclic AMP phosphodiesterase CpdA
VADLCFAAPAHHTKGRGLLVCVLAIAGCGEYSVAGPATQPRDDGSPRPSAYCDALAGAGISLDGAGQQLLGAPLVFAPTSHGFGVSVVLEQGSPASLGVRVRAAGARNWGDAAAPVVRAVDLAEWRIDGLAAGARYDYEVVGCSVMGEAPLHAANVITQRPAGASFTFALISDTHIGADLTFPNQGDEATLTAVSREIAAASPDFLVNLGDMLDYHQYGFNVPPPDAATARQAYVNYRGALGDLSGSAFHYPVIGGWDSESGCNTAAEIDRSRSQRLLYLPSPGPETDPEGGSPFEDYYAFAWGDALFVVLNVYTYTPSCHFLSIDPGLPDDWTLGQTQLDWLRQTLANSRSKWKFLLVHHPVGGNAGDDADSAYGRGGGRAAHVGEQEIVHQMMRDYGVQLFFYGHDHVFTDMVVDGIHYSLPGSAGAIWMFTAAETGYTTFWPDSGWARVDVTSDDVHVRFVPLGGTPVFEYTIR